jgi:hypothetical protein
MKDNIYGDRIGVSPDGWPYLLGSMGTRHAMNCLSAVRFKGAMLQQAWAPQGGGTIVWLDVVCVEPTPPAAEQDGR